MLTVRRIRKEDALLIYEWANDDLTRANSFQSEPIAWEQHLEWFNGKLEHERAIYLMGESDGIPCAFIRFDVSPDFALVGINFSPSFRGKGLSKRVLQAACSVYFQTMHQPIHASIKSTNTASIHLFEGVGFQQKGTRYEQTYTILDYKLEQHE